MTGLVDPMAPSHLAIAIEAKDPRMTSIAKEVFAWEYSGDAGSDDIMRRCLRKMNRLCMSQYPWHISDGIFRAGLPFSKIKLW